MSLPRALPRNRLTPLRSGTTKLSDRKGSGEKTKSPFVSSRTSASKFSSSSSSSKPGTLPSANAAVRALETESYVQIQQNIRQANRMLESIPTVYPNLIEISIMKQSFIEERAKVDIRTSIKNDVTGTGTGTVVDLCMGNPDIRKKCGLQECEKVGCPGHLGKIRLVDRQGKPIPIYNPLCIEACAALFDCFCYGCNRLYGKLPDLSNIPPAERLAAARKILQKKISCDTVPGPGVKPCGQRRYFWVKTFTSKYATIISSTMNKVKDSKRAPGEDVPKPFDPETAHAFLESMNIGDLTLLGFAVDTAEGKNKGTLLTHPRDFVMYSIPVIPYTSRAPTIQKGRMRYDFLTNTYDAIVSILTDQKDTKTVPDSESIYIKYKELIYGTAADKKDPKKKSTCIWNLTQGKKSVIRGSMMGKRNEGTARAVAGCACIRHGTISIPLVIAKVFSQPLKVTKHNFKYVGQLFAENKVDYFIPRSTGVRRDCSRGKLFNYKIGDTIGKFLQEGDWMVNNRHPTLSKPSMMAHKVVFGKTPEQKRDITISHQICDTTPSNMDFDGDERNLVNPICVRARAEAAYLLHVPNIIMSDSQNKPAVGLVVNSILASYLLTYKLVILEETLFRRLLNIISCKDGFDTLFDRLETFGVHPRSGHAIYSALLPPELNVNTLKYNKEKGIYTGVKISRGILIHGALDKGMVGVSHRSLVQEIYKFYGPKRTSLFLTDATFVCNRWIAEYGFSCGIRDFIKHDGEPISKIIEDEQLNIDLKIESLGGPLSDPQQEEVRQKDLNDYLDTSKGIGVKLTKEFVLEDPNNRLGIMHKDRSGVKGDSYNLNQIVGISGPQKYDGKPLERKTRGGTASLPMFVPMSLDPSTIGFIRSNFLKGYEPWEVFFAAEAGRASIVNTNVDTSITGYMQRKIGKVIEGVSIANDGSIRNTNGIIFSPVANCGYAINMLIQVKHPFRGDITFPFDVEQIVERINENQGYYQNSVVDIIQNNVNTTAALLEKEPVPKIDLSPPEGKPYKSYQRKYTGTLGLHRLTRFDRVAIIGRRAQEIENNSDIRISGNDLTCKDPTDPTKRIVMYDPVKIAAAEHRRGLLDDFLVFRNNGDLAFPASIDRLCVQ